MKKKKDDLMKILTIGSALSMLSIASIVFGVFKGYIALINAVLVVFALLFALGYMMKGYKKEAAKYYNGFMIFYAIATLLDIAAFFLLTANTKEINSTMYFVGLEKALVFVCIGALAFGKDLGKDRSLMIGNIIVVVNVLLFTISIGKHDNSGEYIMGFANLLLAVIANLLVNGKYINKQSRGAK